MIKQWVNVALILAFLFVLTDAAAQQHNVGLYNKVSQDGDTTTYELVWSAYVAGAENEPAQPGDFHIPSDGGVGDDGGGGCCHYVQGIGGGDALLSETPAELPPMVVTASSGGVQNIWNLLIAANGGGGGGGGGIGRSIPRQAAGLIAIGNIATTIDIWTEFWVNLHAATWNAALNDIEYFRQVGLHQPHSQGSLINWNQAQVNWNLFGANDPSLTNAQVLHNFIDFVNGGGG